MILMKFVILVKKKHLGNVCKIESNNSKKQMNVLNTVDILLVADDKGQTHIKIFVNMKNRARYDIQFDTDSGFSEIKFKVFEGHFQIIKCFRLLLIYLFMYCRNELILNISN